MDEVTTNPAGSGDIAADTGASEIEPVDRGLLRTQYLEASNRVLTRENVAFREDIGNLKKRIARKNQALETARGRAKTAERDLRRIRSSRSWRMTGFVRAIGRVLRRLKRR